MSQTHQQPASGTSRVSLYDEVTDRIVRELEQGCVPWVRPWQSVTAEHIVCLEDGKKLKMLKRYLRSRYQLSPEDYRAKWGLPADYPMVAPNYAAQRSAFAKKIGLGHRPAEPRRRKRG